MIHKEMEKEFISLGQQVTKVKKAICEIVACYRQILDDFAKEKKYLTTTGKHDVSREVIAIAKLNDGEIMELTENGKESLDVAVGPDAVNKVLDKAIEICVKDCNIHMQLFDRMDRFLTAIMKGEDLAELALSDDEILNEIIKVWYGDVFDSDGIDGLKIFCDRLEKKIISKETILKSLEK
jgi:hypothetical protein